MKMTALFAGASALALAACVMPVTETTAPVTVAEPPVASESDIVAMAGAPLFEGMGDYHREISTDNEYAQRYFDQGMVLAFGFNHAEAIRSFRAAQTMDPSCAMCFWGEALATGPNINVTSKGKALMSMPDREAAYTAIQKAVALKANATEDEQDLIDALAKRYSADFEADREPQDIAWAEAMGIYVALHPEDDDAAAIYAEAWMNTMPWDYWSADGEPKRDTVKVIEALETIIARSPEHPLALHLYIHAVEASSEPGRAENAADTLADLVPASGHLVHMPAHIYWRVGRYDDAATANVKAAAVDEAYIAACNAQGFYPALYYPHNIHFLWAASSMAGQSDVALQSAQKVADNVRIEMIEQFPTVEFFKTIPMLANVQFGKWEEILALEAPPETLDYSNGIWHYARGVAFARTGRLSDAAGERVALDGLKDSVQIDFLDTNDYPATTLLNIADNLLQGEIALESGKNAEAVAYFEAAVAGQDSLPYTEPPFWYYPTRQSLGEALLASGKYEAAEAVYRKDLVDYPHNGWSMFGLMQALDAQGKTEESAKVKEMFDIVWRKADVELTGSRL